SMQVSEIQFFTDDAGTSANVFLNPSAAIAIDHDGFAQDSRSPGSGAEDPKFAIDGDYLPTNPIGNIAVDADPATKYLNFGRENSRFNVTPASGTSVVKTFQIFKANDSPSRDQASWELWGTNDHITSMNNTDGNEE